VGGQHVAANDMIIELPYPNKDLMPNRKNGRHWGATKEIKDKAIYDAHCIALQALKQARRDVLIVTQGLIHMTITYIQSDKRHRDLDNLLAASKPAIDGIAMALNVDDSIFEPITIKRGYNPKQASMRVEL
jgi:crossover junction endodeoxyribonuclease RusA